jgi:Flp pilus assembly protein TadG
MNQRAKFTFASESGSVAVSVAMVLVVLLGMSAVAIDYGHLTWVKGELTKAAEAGALAGSRNLVPYVGAPLTPNWTAGQNRATQTVRLNRADNQALTDSQVGYGYWNLATKTLQPAGIVPTASHLPAVQVTIAKTAEQNGSPIQMFFAPIFGVRTRDLSARAVAVISFPTGVGPGALKPMVATKSIVDNYWNKFDPAHPEIPFQFKIGEESNDPSINDTMWSTFKVVSNSDAYTKALINNGNPEPLYIGESIHLQPGVRAVDYGPNEMGQFVNQTVVLPIVDPVTLVANTEAPVLGFIAFRITGYSQGSKYIEGFFDKDYVITNPQGVGLPNPNLPSTPSPPKLVY